MLLFKASDILSKILLSIEGNIFKLLIIDLY